MLQAWALADEGIYQGCKRALVFGFLGAGIRGQRIFEV